MAAEQGSVGKEAAITNVTRAHEKIVTSSRNIIEHTGKDKEQLLPLQTNTIKQKKDHEMNVDGRIESRELDDQPDMIVGWDFFP